MDRRPSGYSSSIFALVMITACQAAHKEAPTPRPVDPADDTTAEAADTTLTESADTQQLSSSSSGGSLIAFHRFNGTLSQILVLDPVSGQEKALTKGTAQDVGPSFSWDGKKLVFTRQTTANSTSIVTVDVTGKNEKTVIAAVPNVIVSSPAFSPDGRKIAFFEASIDAVTGAVSSKRVMIYDLSKKTKSQYRDVNLDPGARDLQFLRSHYVTYWTPASVASFNGIGNFRYNSGQFSHFSPDYADFNSETAECRQVSVINDGSGFVCAQPRLNADKTRLIPSVIKVGFKYNDMSDYVTAGKPVDVIKNEAAFTPIRTGADSINDNTYFTYPTLSPDGTKLLFQKSWAKTVIVDLQTGQESELPVVAFPGKWRARTEAPRISSADVKRNADGSYTFTVKGKDKDGAIVLWLWDLDNDGEVETETAAGTLTVKLSKPANAKTLLLNVWAQDDRGAQSAPRQIKVKFP